MATAKKSALPSDKKKSAALSGDVERGTLTAGQRAPAFRLAGSDGNSHELKAYLGKNVVLYFYPKDSTPGCTLEAQDFRALAKQFGKKNTVIFGVSKDSIESHCKFRDKYDLNFVLLSDPDCSMMKSYGVFGEKKLYGKVSMGTIRSTFLIGADGVIQKSWSPVRVANHAQAVLEAIDS